MAVDAGKAYDISVIPPKEIRNESIEYTLATRFILHVIGKEDPPPPYDKYFIDEVRFHDSENATLSYRHGDPLTASFVRYDCQVEFYDNQDTIHAELTSGGEEISIERYAIDDYWTKSNGHDTVSFIEFRDKKFKSFDQIIAEFANDHADEYDTITLELTKSRSKE